ncbi:MAG: stalk domain-containing protein, partial [Clostridia bacterium]|nr:stalk domain-containing protein [Clostridia bacterium]
NYVSECASIAILYYGNNHTVEYNDVSKACMETSDQGAIYSGRNWTCRGNIIRYNYIHDMKMINTTTGMKIQAIYLDDMHSSTEVYGNVIYNVYAATLFGGGRNNTFRNNVMIDCEEPFRMDNRGLTWADTSEDSQMMTRLKEVPYTTGIWAETYPELVNILEDDPAVPKYNTITGNVSYRTPEYNLASEVIQYGTFENNITLKDTKAFADYKNKDFTILEDSEVYQKLPDFEPIPFSEIGLLDQKIEASAKDSVVLYIGSPRAVAKGRETLVDPDNRNVQPVVLNDRTLVPVRFIAESFGAQVSWEKETQTVGIAAAGKTISLQIGSQDMKVDGETVQLDVPAQTIEDRTMVPLRAIAEALGKIVFWDDRGLIVMSDGSIVAQEDTFVIDALIRKVTMD